MLAIDLLPIKIVSCKKSLELLLKKYGNTGNFGDIKGTVAPV
jgi:hypothetical protein